jgi:hypothetical protein
MLVAGARVDRRRNAYGWKRCIENDDVRAIETFSEPRGRDQRVHAISLPKKLSRLVKVGAAQEVSAGTTDELAATVFKTRRAGRAVDHVVLGVDGALELRLRLLCLAGCLLLGHAVSLTHFSDFSTDSGMTRIESCSVGTAV